MAQNTYSSIAAMLSFTKYLPLALPLLNLGLVFLQQSTSGVTDALISMLHVLSNPIDALWSIMCRQEAARRCYLFAARHTPDVAREMAVVLSTYDHWMQNACSDLVSALHTRRTIASDRGVLSEQEKIQIRQAALRLRSCHKDGSVNARISAMAYIASLMLLFWKVLQWNDDTMRNEAGRIFSLIAASSHLLLVVRLNGRTGSFTHQEEAARTTFELAASLKDAAEHQGQASLAVQPESGVDTKQSSHATASDFSRQQAGLGFVSGMLNCVRAKKSYVVDEDNSQPTTSLALIAACAVLVSSLGAFGVVLTASASGDIATLIAVGVCFGLWTMNWLGSITLGALLQKSRISITTYARVMLATDLMTTVAIICCFGWSFCIEQGEVAAAKQGDGVQITVWLLLMLAQMFSMSLLGFCADSEGMDIRRIFVRSFDEALADIDALLVRSV